MTCAFVPTFAACTSSPMVAGVPQTADHLVIGPYQTHAQCLDMRRGDRLDWRFDATAPLAFDIHYRESNALLAPVVRNAASDAGTFEAREPANYCVTWEAGAAGASLDYRLLLRAATR
ncbi:MAG TPA: hypothetical protein VFI50_13665 [Casimicrobiaceae bacterium]|nr:hypothetical protein [Casimicrobiaceae bacterium]